MRAILLTMIVLLAPSLAAAATKSEAEALQAAAVVEHQDAVAYYNDVGVQYKAASDELSVALAAYNAVKGKAKNMQEMIALAQCQIHLGNAGNYLNAASAARSGSANAANSAGANIMGSQIYINAGQYDDAVACSQASLTDSGQSKYYSSLTASTSYNSSQASASAMKSLAPFFD